MSLIVKFLLSALLIVLISEIAKRSAQFGALIGSLPLISLIAIVWLFYETGDVQRIRSYSMGVFWYVLPSLVFFLLFPWCLQRFPFWGSMGVSIGATFLCYLVTVQLLARFGMKL